MPTTSQNEPLATIELPARRSRLLDRIDASILGLTDTEEIRHRITDMLCSHLQATRCIYADIGPADTGYLSSPRRPHEFSAAALTCLRAGENFIVQDTETDPRIETKAAYRAKAISALVCVPVPRHGPLAAALAIHSATPRVWTEGEITLIEAVAGRCFEAITRLHTLQELRESEESLRLALDAGAFGHYAYELGAQQSRVSPRFAEIFGYSTVTRDWNFGRWLEHLHPDDRQRVNEIVAASEKSSEPIQYEARFFRHGEPREEKNVRWIWLRARYSHRDDGRRYRYGIIADITDRKRVEAALEKSRSEVHRQWVELESIYQTAPIGLTLLSADEFRYLRVNEVQSKAIGYPPDQIVGRLFRDVVPGLAPTVEPYLHRVAHGESFRDLKVEGELPSQPGVRRYWTVNYMPIRSDDGVVRAISALIIETTAQKRAELALIESEKLAAVGRLASSISHEINNPLEAITNLLYIAAKTEGLPTEAKEAISLAEQELMRVSQIASQTLRFHRQSTKPTWVTPTELLRPVLALYQGRLVNSNVELVEEHAPVKPVECFENDLRQVLNNLIGNAIDAMRSGVGSSAFQSRVLIRSHEATEPHTGRLGVRITIADSGTGMSSTTRQNLFNAFYTTKGMNGTGLGLWISKGIMDKHEGSLRVYSSDRPGRSGTVFQMFLPRVSK